MKKLHSNSFSIQEKEKKRIGEEEKRKRIGFFSVQKTHTHTGVSDRERVSETFVW